jgi:hippurate hydrolase
MRVLVLVLAACSAPSTPSTPVRAQESPGKSNGDLEALYRDLHAHPELSGQEARTAELLAARLSALGLAVTTGVGGTGVVGVLENGAGPTVMLRSELDALPVEERTGLPYASQATGTIPSGETVRVMHACGHDVHMTVVLGATERLVRERERWRGKLLVVLQPAEEVGTGARAMLDDGLFTRFPRPDFALALHCLPDLAAGTIGWVAGPAKASVDSVDVTIFGAGGHGALPHKTVDPIVIAARFVLALQTLISREKDPRQPAVITVGSIHGGTKHNVIPDEVKLQLTVRAYDEGVRAKLLAGIERMARAEAEAALAPKPPAVTIAAGSLGPTINDPALTERLALALARTLGEERVIAGEPLMTAEDFGEYGRAGVAACQLQLGTSEPAALAAARATGTALPTLHSSGFAPDLAPTLRTGIEALTSGALELLGG